MMDFYSDSRAFIHKLSETDSPSQIASFCKIPLQVVYAILSDPVYDMGTVNHRRILCASIEYTKRQKAVHRDEVNERLYGYKENRSIEPPRLKERMKGL